MEIEIRKNLRTYKQTKFDFGKEEMTKHHFKDECDINNIIKRYNAKGVLPEMIKQDPIWGDFSNAVDYHEAMNTVAKAHQQFEALPSQLRDKFNNDPRSFLEFCSNPENAAEMEKMGLAKKIPESQDVKVLNAIKEGFASYGKDISGNTEKDNSVDSNRSAGKSTSNDRR